MGRRSVLCAGAALSILSQYDAYSNTHNLTLLCCVSYSPDMSAVLLAVHGESGWIGGLVGGWMDG